MIAVHRTIGAIEEVKQMQAEATTTVNEVELSDWPTRVYGAQKFAGAGKSNSGLLVPLERRLARFVLPRIPSWIQTYHLTLTAPVWAIGVVAFSYLAKSNLRWLWLVNLMHLLHYFTDHYDGKLGKYRDTGLYKWGFYVDHLFDYVFLCSVLIGYTFLIPERAFFNMLLVLCVFSGLMFHIYLMLAMTSQFKISFSRFGPTEMVVGLIVANALIIKFGVRPLKGSLLYVAVGGALVLGILAFRAQKRLWRLDMEAKQREQRAS